MSAVGLRAIVPIKPFAAASADATRPHEFLLWYARAEGQRVNRTA